MSRKIDRALRGPSWIEVTLGAAISIVLGAVLGAAILILRPVIVAKEEPKERVKNAVYYFDGSRDATRGAQAGIKKQALVQGRSVSLNEDEVNALIGSAAAKPADKPKDAAPAQNTMLFGYATPGTPTVRIRDGVFQVAVPVTVEGLPQKVIVQTRGTFVKRGDAFVYEPQTMHIGSCAVERIPTLATYIRDQFLALQPVPEDLRAAWLKLTDVAVDGNVLQLTMP